MPAISAAYHVLCVACRPALQCWRHLSGFCPDFCTPWALVTMPRPRQMVLAANRTTCRTRQRFWIVHESAWHRRTSTRIHSNVRISTTFRCLPRKQNTVAPFLSSSCMPIHSDRMLHQCPTFGQGALAVQWSTDVLLAFAGELGAELLFRSTDPHGKPPTSLQFCYPHSFRRLRHSEITVTPLSEALAKPDPEYRTIRCDLCSCPAIAPR